MGEGWLILNEKAREKVQTYVDKNNCNKLELGHSFYFQFMENLSSATSHFNHLFCNHLHLKLYQQHARQRFEFLRQEQSASNHSLIRHKILLPTTAIIIIR